MTSLYAGDIDPREAWDRLAAEAGAQMVDVRSEAEWAYVGLPDLGPVGRSIMLCAWANFPAMEINQDFTKALADLLDDAGYKPGAALLFLCRSGARSRSAAIAMTEVGFAPCFNVRNGFEGPLDAKRHRGLEAGWKASNLPWIQG